MNTLEVELDEFFGANDYSKNTVRGIRCDLSKLVRWFEAANGERFDVQRLTTRDLADFRSHLRDVRRQSVSSVNRALVSARRFLNHLVTQGKIALSPARGVKQLKRMPSVPRGLTTAQVRRILRETEIRGDRRASAMIGLMLHGGLRVSDVVGLELQDVTIGPRSGQAVIRSGKGRRTRIVPLSIESRRVLTEYLEVRPASPSNTVFIGERGPLTEDGVRTVCEKYAMATGVPFTPHVLRHTFAHRFLEQTSNDLIALGQILGHSHVSTTAIYAKRSQDDLQQRVEGLRYE